MLVQLSIIIILLIFLTLFIYKDYDNYTQFGLMRLSLLMNVLIGISISISINLIMEKLN